jgi:hypothetical protein
MRLSLLLGLFVVPCSVVACTALLGDFTVGTGSDASDTGGNDVAADNASDVGEEGDGETSTFYKLHCMESGQRVQITTGASLHPDIVRSAIMPSGLLRMVATDYEQDDSGSCCSVTFRSYAVDLHNTSAGSNPLPFVTSGRALAIERYEGSPPGFVVLYTDFDQSANTTYLSTARIVDDASSWTTAATRIVQLPTNNNNNLEADLTAINGATDDYYVVYSYVSGSTQLVYAGEGKSGSGSGLTAVGSFDSGVVGRNSYDLTRPGVAYRSSRGYGMLSPAGNNGPPPLGAACVVVSEGGNFTISPPSTLNFFPIAFGNATDPLTVNASFLIADLTQLQGYYGIGQLPATSLATMDPQKFPATKPTAPDGGASALKDLFIGNNGGAHWEIVNSVQQFIATVPTTDPLSANPYLGGLNFAWWDAPTGAVRVYQAGDGAVLKDVQYPTAADSSVVALIGSIGQVAVAFTSAPAKPTQNNPPPAADLWLAQLGCIK